MFGGVPMAVSMPPNIVPKDRGINNLEGGNFETAASAVMAGNNIAVAATLFICYFFRDPDRVVPDQDGAVVSPADGKVIKAYGSVDPRGHASEVLADLDTLNAER